MSRRQPAEWAHAVSLGNRIKAMREARRYTRAELARRAAEYGVAWPHDTVRPIKEGRRLVKAYELAVIASILGTSAAELLDGLPIGSPARLNPWDEGSAQAAARLDLTVQELDEAARQLWGRPLHAEREARLDANEEKRLNQAHRGHVTRAMLTELRRHLSSA